MKTNPDYLNKKNRVTGTKKTMIEGWKDARNMDHALELDDDWQQTTMPTWESSVQQPG